MPMWVDYKAVAALLDCCAVIAYKVINKLKSELEEQGYLVNPNAKVPIKFFCERYNIDIETAKKVVSELKESSKSA